MWCKLCSSHMSGVCKFTTATASSSDFSNPFSHVFLSLMRASALFFSEGTRLIHSLSENSCTNSARIPNWCFTNISTAPLVFIRFSLQITEFNHENTVAESVLTQLPLQGQIYHFENCVQLCYVGMASIILFPKPGCIFHLYSTHLQHNTCYSAASITPHNSFLGLQHIPSPSNWVFLFYFQHLFHHNCRFYFCMRLDVTAGR